MTTLLLSDYLPKEKKYSTETNIFIKISLVFKNLFQSVREKNKIEKVVHEQFKLNIVNQKRFLVEHCVRKILSRMRKNLSCVRKSLS